MKKQLEPLGLTPGAHVYIRILKKSSLLELWMKTGKEYKLFKKYEICSYSGRLGPKLKQWDYQAPEGFYGVVPARLNYKSSYHFAFDVGYPNKFDAWHDRTGGNIKVHGKCVSSGCFAMTDACIEEIYTLVALAFRNKQFFVPVHIFPFYMTEKNMETYKSSEWYSFWEELKVGYDYFEKEKNPPKVSVVEGRYIIKQ